MATRLRASVQKFFLFAMLAAICLSQCTRAQSNPNLDNGIKAYGSYDTGSIDSIDLATGALSVNIPLLSFPQRGDLPPVKVEIHYGSKAFTINGHCVTPPNQGEPYCEPHWQTVSPFSTYFGATLVVDDGSVDTAPTMLVKGPPSSLYSYAVHTSDGASHPLFPSPFSSGAYISGDGTGFTCTSGCSYTSDSATRLTYTRTGIWTGGTYGVEDPNGNVLTWNYNTSTESDTLGRPLNALGTTTPDLTGCTGDLSTTGAGIQNLPGYNGGTAQIKLCYTTLLIDTAFNDSTYEDQYGNTSPWESGATVVEAGDAVPSILQAVLLYDGNSWTTSPAWIFHYNNGANGTNVVNYGDLTGITLPTGGTIQYSYATQSQCGGSGYPGFVNMSRAVTQRVENANDGSPAVVTTYSPLTNGMTTVNDGTNDTAHGFEQFGQACQFYEDSVQYYSGSGSNRTLLKTVATDYTYSNDPYSNLYADGKTRAIGVTPIRVTTTLPNGLVSKVEQDHQTATTSFLDTSYTLSTGDVVQKREYDWGNGSPGALIRCTATTYQSQQSSSYMTANLLDLPATVSVYSGACSTGTLMSQTTYGYDQTYLTSSGVTVQRDSNAASLSTRGNLTTRTLWVNTASSNINEYNLYYDTGEKYQHTDFKSNPPTTYSYDLAYDGAYLTKTQLPTTGSFAHSVSARYDFNTGLMSSYTDQNSNVSQYTYDPLLRMSTASFPDGGSTQFSYPSFTSVQKTVKMNATQSTQLTDNFDGLGRLVNTTLSEGGSSSIFTRTAYDAQGRKAQVWNPSRCDQRTATSCSGETTWGSTQFQYDGLNRQTLLTPPDGSAETTTYIGNTTTFTDEVGNQWSRTSDALGRLKSVLEPNGVSTAPTMETDYAYNALDDLTSVTQWGGASGTAGAESRSFSYDSLSRLLTSSNPETGTICYGVWSGSTCGNGYDANSNLVAKTDARGVTTTYGYDVLNRLLAKTYTGGTLSSCYSYDSGTYGVGLLASEWTQTGTCPTNGVPSSPQTETSLGYDPMGRVGSRAVVTPDLSATVSATYDFAGHRISQTYPDGRVVQNSFDTTGRLNAVTYSSWNGTAMNQPYLTTTNGYDPADHLAYAIYGNGTQYYASYDDRERASKLTYGPPGPLWQKQYAWAANGNLQSQTDLVTGVQRQYNYDTLNRLTAAQDIYSNLAVPSSANGNTTSTSTSGSGAEETPGGTGALPEWTDPYDSNLLGEVGGTDWAASSSVTATQNAGPAPDGSNTALQVQASSSAPGSSSIYIDGTVSTPSAYSLETMGGSVWLKSSDTTSPTINLYLMANGAAAGSKQVQLSQTWQQVALTASMPDNLTSLYFEIGGGGTISAGHGVLVWNAMLEDHGIAGRSVTNYLPYSQLPTASTWSGVSYTAASSSVAAPDGSQTVSAITLAAGGTGSYIANSVTNPAPLDQQAVTGSVFLQATSGTLSTVVYIMESTGGTAVVCGQTPATLTTSWQRVRVSCTAQNALSKLYLQVGGAQLTSSASLQLWGAQLELASVAGPYVPTDSNPASMETTLTNLLPYSEQMTTTPSWQKAQNTISTTAVAAPDGSLTASQISQASGTSQMSDQAVTPELADGATVTGSIYLKWVSGPTTVNLSFYAASSAGTQTLGSQNVTLTSTWQRFQTTVMLPSGLTTLALQFGGTANQTYQAWGAQLEIASQAGPYVETSALPVITGSEPTNILPNSQSLSGANWVLFNSSTTVTPMYTGNTAPDGTNTAALLQASTSSTDSGIKASVPNPSLYDSETVTASVYLRAVSNTQGVNLYIQNIGTTGSVAAAQTYVTATTTWQRFSLTATLENGNTTLYLQIGGAGSIKAGQSVEIWGAQFVIGSSPAPYTDTNNTTTVYATPGQTGYLVPTGLNQAYSYDPFGNIKQNGSFSSSYTANNQMLGYSYDAAGNLLSDGVNSMTWDAESRMATSAGATYIYDAEGTRVEKQGSAVMDAVYFGGAPIARYSGGQWTDLIYGPNGLLAEVPGTQNGVPLYRATDYQGTIVGSLLANGTFVDPVDHTPFGQVFSGNTSDPYLFTGKERDAESGLDYFGARYYGSNMGRFMSPDWAAKAEPVPYAKLDNPQSLNLYAYVNNNPLRMADKDGHSGDACANSSAQQCSVTTDAKNKTATVTETNQKVTNTTDNAGHIISTTVTTTTTVTTVTTGTDAHVEGATQTTSSKTTSLNQDGTLSTTTTPTQTTQLNTNQLIQQDPGRVSELTKDFSPSMGERAMDHKVGIGGLLLGGGAAVSCILAEPCGAGVAITGIVVGVGAGIYDYVTH